MFEDNQTDSHITNHDEIIEDTTPHVGLGTNPSLVQAATQATPVDPDPATTDDAQVVDEPAPETSYDALDHIKLEALNQLSPLIDKLDQSPEEKFNTLYMMIQASDNHALISEAYEIALQISDETVKAKALLNIVNEINYFHQKAQS